MAVKYLLLLAFAAVVQAETLQEALATNFGGVCTNCVAPRCAQYLSVCPVYLPRLRQALSSSQQPQLAACRALNRLPAVALNRQCRYLTFTRETGQILETQGVQCLCQNGVWQQCVAVQDNTIIDVIDGNDKMAYLGELLDMEEYAELHDILDTVGAGAMTLFVPTEEAFQQLVTDLDLDLVADAALITQVLEYHLLTTGGWVMRVLISANAVVTAEGSALELQRVIDENRYLRIRVVTSTDADAPNNFVLAYDIVASNGIIHYIDSVLVPETLVTPEEGLNTFEVLHEQPETELVHDILSLDYPEYVEVREYLEDPANTITFFCPESEAFEVFVLLNIDQFGDPTEAENAEFYSFVLFYHMLSSTFMITDFPLVASATTTVLNDVYGAVGFELDLIRGTVIVNFVAQAAVLFLEDNEGVYTLPQHSDIMASNGVVHVINEPLPGLIVEASAP